MKIWLQELYLSWNVLRRIAREHMVMLMLQIISFCVINSYNVIVVPIVITKVYEALERQNIKLLIMTCAIGGIFIGLMFLLSYINNVYLDLNSFRITLTAVEKSCKELLNLQYDDLRKKYAKEEIVNRIDECTKSISGIFPLCVLVLSNIISFMILLVLAGKFSGVVLILSLFTVVISFLMSRYESKHQEYYEKEKQKHLDKAGGFLKQAVSQIVFSKMYEKENRLWSHYEIKRDKLWESMWKQEKLGVYREALMDTVTNVLYGILGWCLFGYYQNHEVNAQKVASSFSVFDQMKIVANNFVWPITAVRKSIVAVMRFEEMFQDTESKIIVGSEEKSNEVVQMQGVFYSIGDRKILNNIDLSIMEGEKVLILGENGSGKTSLLRIVSGLYYPSIGNVLIQGNDSRYLDSEKIREKITYIPANSFLYDQSVEKNILMNGKEGEEEKLMEVSRLSCLNNEMPRDVLHKNVSELSGGEKQRVNIARGLLHSATMLLADEPDAGLPKAQANIVIKNIISKTKTAIVILHNCDEIELFTRVLLMKDGEILLDKSPKEIITCHEYIKWRGMEKNYEV